MHKPSVPRGSESGLGIRLPHTHTPHMHMHTPHMHMHTPQMHTHTPHMHIHTPHMHIHTPHMHKHYVTGVLQTDKVFA